MMRIKLKELLAVSCLLLATGIAAAQAPAFKVVPLGVRGGIDESNLSAYMVAPYGTRNYICLDAGTLHYGIQKAVDNKVFAIPAVQVLRQYIKAYFISHSHLDHLSGLIINSPDDSSKTIYANEQCIGVFKSKYFTWNAWANFAAEGEKPQLGKYRYSVLTPGSTVTVEGTGLTVQAFALSHSNLQSTAFLVNNAGSYLLYLGDTGPDEVEHSQNLQNLWQAVAPLIKAGQLKAIMLEASFANAQPDNTLFGHLTPRWFMAQMDALARLTGPSVLQRVNIVVTHIKPPQSQINLVRQQLAKANVMQLKLVYPVQGRALSF